MGKLAFAIAGVALLFFVAAGLNSNPGPSAHLISRQIAGLRLVEDVSAAEAPAQTPVSATQAVAAGAAQLHQLVPAVTRLQFGSPKQGFGIVSAADETGNQVLQLSSPIDAWVIQVTAPDQGTMHHIHGYVVVNAQTGVVQAASLATS
jgi:hypothetical protein